MEYQDKLFLVVNFICWFLVYGIWYFQLNVSHDAISPTVSISTSLQKEDVGKEQNSKITDKVANTRRKDYEESSDDGAISIIAESLAGTYYTKNGYSFYFGPNGYYAGFFDNDNTYVDNCTYKLTEKDNAITLTIYSSDNSCMVSYLLLMNGTQNYTLIYEPTNYNIELEKEK